MNNLLSIDYGERFVGCAVRTFQSKVPFPVAVIDSKTDDLSNLLEIMIKEYEIKDILSAVDSITKIDRKKNKEIEGKKQVLTVNKQVKSNESEILVLDEMIE